MSAAISRHGTTSRYQDGCRCESCTAANTAYARRKIGGNHAGRQELVEWMIGLGWDRAIPRAIPKMLVDRWNREHSDRPYVGGN